jgi:glycosyltransferase involved in cell wall biosynthesis
MPLVSVIVPAYGHGEYILQTLDSVFGQTFRDYEIIVVNDGSPDDTATVLTHLIQVGKIRYFEQKNQGVAAARNYGISRANGNYIALLDDDDLWPPDKLEWQVKCLEEGTAIAVGGGADLFNRNGLLERLQETSSTDLPVEKFFSGNPFHSPGQVLFRKSAFDDGARFDITIWGADDIDFWVELASRGPFEYHARLALNYRVHDSNASRNRLPMLLNSLKFLEKRTKSLAGNQLSNCRNEGYRWLFSCVGRKLVWEARFALFSRTPRVIYGLRLFYELFRIFGRTRSEAPETYRAFKDEVRRALIVDLRKSVVSKLNSSKTLR